MNVSKECYVEYAQKLSKHRRPVFPSQADVESRFTEAYKVKTLADSTVIDSSAHEACNTGPELFGHIFWRSLDHC